MAAHMQNPGLAPRASRNQLGGWLHLFPYRIGMAGANACLPFLPVAVDGAGHGAALLWGGLQ